MTQQAFYNDWAKEKIQDPKRETILKWKAVNLLNLLMRNGFIDFAKVCEVGGAEGIVLNTIRKTIKTQESVNYEISDTFCHMGMEKYPAIKFINREFQNQPEKFDLVILSDITEHVDNDITFLYQISKYCTYLAIKIPIEKSLFSSRFYQALRFKKIPETLKYGKSHINGHLRGYTVRQAKTFVSRFYRILDKEIVDIPFIEGNPKKKILKKLLGKRLYILLYGGAFFAFGKSLNIS